MNKGGVSYQVPLSIAPVDIVGTLQKRGNRMISLHGGYMTLGHNLFSLGPDISIRLSFVAAIIQYALCVCVCVHVHELLCF